MALEMKRPKQRGHGAASVGTELDVVPWPTGVWWIFLLASGYGGV